MPRHPDDAELFGQKRHALPLLCFPSVAPRRPAGMGWRIFLFIKRQKKARSNPGLRIYLYAEVVAALTRLHSGCLAQTFASFDPFNNLANLIGSSRSIMGPLVFNLAPFGLAPDQPEKLVKLGIGGFGFVFHSCCTLARGICHIGPVPRLLQWPAKYFCAGLINRRLCLLAIARHSLDRANHSGVTGRSMSGATAEKASLLMGVELGQKGSAQQTRRQAARRIAQGLYPRA